MYELLYYYWQYCLCCIEDLRAFILILENRYVRTAAYYYSS